MARPTGEAAVSTPSLANLSGRPGKNAVRAASPETAEWLNRMTAAFGRPAAVRVVVDGRVIYAMGQFHDERESDTWRG